MTARRRLLALALLALLPAAARGHAFSAAYVELTESDSGAVSVLWKIPIRPRGIPELALSLPCPAASPPARSATPAERVERWMLQCPAPLVGRSLAIEGLAENDINALLQLNLRDGRRVRAILTAEQTSYQVPARESAADVFVSYVELGVEHLLTGADHLLFVAGLVLLLGARRRLLVGVTAFTAGHSVTLALSALDLLHVPQPIAELAIAGSIVVLGLELSLRRSTGRVGALERRPALLPLAFGLMHGLGFAGALRSVGLPSTEIPLALFSFNVGIELGQLAAIALVLPVVVIVSRISARAPGWLAELPATAIGGVGMLWCIERSVGLLIS